MIKKRFPDEIAERLEKTQWWNLEDSKMEKLAEVMNDPEAFLKTIEG